MSKVEVNAVGPQPDWNIQLVISRSGKMPKSNTYQ